MYHMTDSQLQLLSVNVQVATIPRARYNFEEVAHRTIS